MVSTTDFIAAIEFGSSKIAGIVGKKNQDGTIEVMAYVSKPSAAFIRKGVIFNLGKTTTALKEIVEELEKTINSTIGKIYVGVGGKSLHTEKNVISRNLKEETVITQEIVDNICDENLVLQNTDTEILDVAPQEYKIGINMQADPVGIAGDQIEGRFVNVMARSSLKKNIETCVKDAGLEIADILVSPLITADAVLSETETRSGCALVDMGADTTTLSIYKNNILRFLTVLPIGGDSITRDISSLQMEEQEAEELKLKYGNAMPDEEAEESSENMELEDGRELNLIQLNDIVSARAEEIVLNVLNQMEPHQPKDKLFAGVIITGGNSNLKNMDKLFQKNDMVKKFRTAKIVRPEILGKSNLIPKDGTANTILGLLIAGEENCYVYKQETPDTSNNDGKIPDNLFDGDEELRKQEEAAKEAKRLKEEEEKKRREEEKRRKQEERKNKTSWFKSTFDKISNEIFSDEDMK